MGRGVWEHAPRIYFEICMVENENYDDFERKGL